MNIGVEHTTENAAPAARRRAIRWFCAAFIAVQLLVPVYKLSLPPNQAFGWQMYSSLTGYTFEVVSEDGTRRVVDPSDYVLRYRGEIDYRNHLPPILCREFPEATRVVATVSGAKGARSYPCGH